MRWLCTFAFLTLVSPIAFSDTIRVPDDYATIQQAVDAAVDGDVVIVRPGTYFENIQIWNKAKYAATLAAAEQRLAEARQRRLLMGL